MAQIIPNPTQLGVDLVQVAKLVDPKYTGVIIDVAVLPAPHDIPELPAGKMAVFLFSLARRAPVTLMVGSAGPGPKSRVKFSHQQYGVWEWRSSLANSIANSKDKWDLIDFGVKDSQSTGQWIQANVDRVHFLLDAAHGLHLLRLMEAFVRCRYPPLFETRR